MGGKAVDVISVCRADGSIEPLRLRVEGEQHQLIRVDIEEVVSRREIPYVGMEAHVFLCRGTMEHQSCMFEIMYLFRAHCWRILRRLY